MRFQNRDAGKYTDDNAQGVFITSPSTIGENQDKWSAVLNNTMTDDDFFLQSGMQFKEDGTGLIGWTDDSRKLRPVEFEEITFSTSTAYYFTNTYTNSAWYMCVAKVSITSPSQYECKTSPDATGTHLKNHLETSVAFENANREAGWQNGFPSTVTAHGAKTYRNGTGHAWRSERKMVAHYCSESYPLSNVISGTLLGSGTGTWTLSGIPLSCVPEDDEDE